MLTALSLRMRRGRGRVGLDLDLEVDKRNVQMKDCSTRWNGTSFLTPVPTAAFSLEELDRKDIIMSGNGSVSVVLVLV